MRMKTRQSIIQTHKKRWWRRPILKKRSEIQWLRKIRTEMWNTSLRLDSSPVAVLQPLLVYILPHSQLVPIPRVFSSARLYCPDTSETISASNSIYPNIDMSDPPRAKESAASQLGSPVKNLLSKFRRSPPPQVPVQSALGTQQTIAPLASHSLQIFPWVPPWTSPSNASNMSAPILASAAPQANSGPFATESPQVTTSTASSMHSRKIEAQDIHYTAIGGLPTTLVVPETGGQRANAVGSVVYEGLKQVVQGLYDCSDMFLPLKAATAGLLTIIKIVDAVSDNKKELEDLKAKLEAIISIVKKYQKHNSLRVLDHRIENFCQAIALQLKAVEELQDHSLLTRAAEGTKDADTILKAFRNISSLCDVFQIDTQLNIEETVGDIDDTVKGILQHLNSASIKFGNFGDSSARGTETPFDRITNFVSSRALHNSADRYDPPKCHQNTRVAVLEKLKDWITGKIDTDSLIMWLYGFAGAGKSAIAQTLAELCDEEGLLLAAFFFSRIDPTRNTVAPLAATIAYQLAVAIPGARPLLERAVERNPMVFQQSLETQITQLIIQPFSQLSSEHPTNKLPCLIIIDGLDECSSSDLQCQVPIAFGNSLKKANNTQIRVLVSSRPEQHLLMTFNSKIPPSLLSRLALNDSFSPNDDIEVFLDSKFTDIKKHHPLRSYIPSSWPGREIVTQLVRKSSGQFIYASVVAKDISFPQYHPIDRLNVILGLQPARQEKDMPFAELDALYSHILSVVKDREMLLRILGVYLFVKPSGISNGIYLKPYLDCNKITSIERLLF
ncbi:hypothetical protein BYT27DRAFT_6945768 [Phlegmacium glaucopus]|nr:hypothetical protein BYT27DRAFT_6945768 [Phlegmacium glaucopus]